jgi:hypothetical protein
VTVPQQPTNPFPDYPVVRLQDDAGEVARRTVLTPPIAEARQRVDEYAAGWAAAGTATPPRRQPVVVGVRGDYGSGKTHLLLDAAARAEERLRPAYPAVRVLRVAAAEADPVAWFRAAVGPGLKALAPWPRAGASDPTPPEGSYLQDLLVALYARAGEQVARQAKLTEAVDEKLKAEPRAIFKLVRDDLLNATAVEEALQKRLREVCRQAGEDVRRALAGLLWQPTADLALRWLAGEALPAADLAVLHLGAPLAAEADAAGVLVAVAALHAELGLPFGLMIDEIEQLTRYDDARGGKRNATWLKRLLEALAGYPVMVFLAGHTSAWEGHEDFIQRLSPGALIDMRALSGEDVLTLLLRPRVPRGVFHEAEAAALAEAGRGNIRVILSLCRLLFEDSNGFDHLLTAEQVRAAAERLQRRLTLDEAARRFAGLLGDLGLAVRERATLGRLPFDLAGYRDGRPALVADFRHALTQSHFADAARQFAAKLAEVRGAEPQLLGCLVADGNVDADVAEVRSALRDEAGRRILIVDLNRPAALDRARGELSARLSGGPPSDATEAQLAAVRADNARLATELADARRRQDDELARRLAQQQASAQAQLEAIKADLARTNAALAEKLAALEKSRVDELKEVYERLDKERRAAARRNAPVVSPQPGEADPRTHELYNELRASLSGWTALRYALSSRPLAGRRAVNSYFQHLIRVRIPRLFSTSLILFVACLLTFIGFFGPRLASIWGDDWVLNVLSSVQRVCLGFAAAGWVYLLWIIPTRAGQFNSYFEQCNHLLRQLYLSNARPNDLLTAYELFQGILEYLGPGAGRRALREVLYSPDAADAREILSRLGRIHPRLSSTVSEGSPPR